MSTTIKSGHAVEIYGVTYTIQLGTFLRPEEWSYASRLEVSDWDKAEFRIASNCYPGVSVAVNVKFTGRTLQRAPYSDMKWIKVEIEFVGDGEPSTFSPGWVAALRS